MFVCSTQNSQCLKIIVNCLKDLIPTCMMVINSQGITITHMSSSGSIIVNVNLNASQFDQFNLDTSQLILEVSLLQLALITSTIEDNDTITLSVSDEYICDDMRPSKMSIELTNKDIGKNQHYSLCLLNGELCPLAFPTLFYSGEVVMKSSSFARVVKEFNSYEAKYLDISVNDKTCTFSCSSRFLSSSTSIAIKDGANFSFNGSFDLKSLLMFVKAHSLAKNVKLCVENNKPLLLKYETSLGDITLCLSNKK